MCLSCLGNRVYQQQSAPPYIKITENLLAVTTASAITVADCATATPFPPLSPSIVNLALQPETFGAGPQAVAKMAQPTAEPVEDYEYVFALLQSIIKPCYTQSIRC